MRALFRPYWVVQLLFFLVASTGYTQYVFNDEDRSVQFRLLDTSQVTHSAMRPYDPLELRVAANAEPNKVKLILPHAHVRMHRPALSYKDTNAFLWTVNPIVQAEAGFELEDESRGVWRSRIGALVAGRYKDKFQANLGYHTGNFRPLSFVEGLPDSLQVVAGEGLARDRGTSYGFQNLIGRVAFMPTDQFLLEGGRGKHFWGDGYRSLLLSDVANAFNYFKATARVWVFKYTVLYGHFQDISGAGRDRSAFQNKFGTFHFLDVQLGKRLNLGFYESVIWQGQDTLVDVGFDFNYLNPVIFYRPVEFSTGSAHNSLIGANVSYRFWGKSQVYGQLIIDEFLLSDFVSQNGSWRNKHGVQIGMKKFLGWENGNRWMLQGEYNQVRPYTYAHGSTLQNYAHFNQPLAHPLGANFRELVGIVSLQSGSSWQLEAKGVYSIVGLDSNNLNFGSNLYQPYETRIGDLNNVIGQGIERTLVQGSLRASYLLSSSMNLQATAIAGVRLVGGTTDPNSLWFSLGLSTNLYNRYNDF